MKLILNATLKFNNQLKNVEKALLVTNHDTFPISYTQMISKTYSFQLAVLTSLNLVVMCSGSIIRILPFPAFRPANSTWVGNLIYDIF